MTTKSASTEHPAITIFKNKANHLKSLLKGRTPEVSLGESLDILSKIEGRKKGWNEMSADLKAQIPTEENNRLLDDFLEKTLLPKLSDLARRANLVPHFSSPITSTDDGAGRQSNFTLQSTNDSQFCRLTGDLKVVNNSINWSWLSLEFSFPHEAFAVATKLLNSEVMTGDLTPQLTRCFDRQPEEGFVLSLETYGTSATVRKPQNIWDDQNRLEEFFEDAGAKMESIAPVLRDFNLLVGHWGAPKRLRALENSIWTCFEGTPRYHAKSPVFHTMEIGGINLEAYATEFGPQISGPKGGVQIGAGEIIFLDEPRSDAGPKGKMRGFCIAKYGDPSQPRISLEGLSKQEVLEVAAEFGVPPSLDTLELLGLPKGQETYSRFHDKMFYKTPSFTGLVKWIDKNRKFANDLGSGNASHLPEWYQFAQQELELSQMVGQR